MKSINKCVKAISIATGLELSVVTYNNGAQSIKIDGDAFGWFSYEERDLKSSYYMLYGLCRQYINTNKPNPS